MIQRRVLDPLAMRILRGEFGEGDHVLADLDGDTITFGKKTPVGEEAVGA
jgi:ATP-dependent Clp protease ATP-binding subunit ClpA